MRNKIENEDILIARGACLDGTKAPVDFDKKRAKAFVKKSLASRSSTVWYIAGSLAFAACLAFFIVLNNPGGTKGSINKIESVHCTIDTVATATDSTLQENVEIISIDE